MDDRTMGLGSAMVSSSYGPIVYFGLRWSTQAIFIRIRRGHARRRTVSQFLHIGFTDL